MKSKIKFKKPTENAFDAEKINRYLSDEFGQWASTPIDMANWNKKVTIDGKEVKPLVFIRSKKKNPN